MATKVEEIIEQLKTLTLLEAAELVKQIETTFNVSAASSVGAISIAAPSGLLLYKKLKKKQNLTLF